MNTQDYFGFEPTIIPAYALSTYSWEGSSKESNLYNFGTYADPYMIMGSCNSEEHDIGALDHSEFPIYNYDDHPEVLSPAISLHEGLLPLSQQSDDSSTSLRRKASTEFSRSFDESTYETSSNAASSSSSSQSSLYTSVPLSPTSQYRGACPELSRSPRSSIPSSPEALCLTDDEVFSPCIVKPEILACRPTVVAAAFGRIQSSAAQNRRRRRGRAIGERRGSSRKEKPFKCDKNGCIKAYLNPNGLKYHLEKGTCEFSQAELPPLIV